MPPEAPTAPSPSLENRVSVFDKIGGSIDDLVDTVKAIPGALKEAAYYSYCTAKPLTALAGAYFLGGTKTLVNACIIGGGFIAGKVLGKLKNKEKIFTKETYKELSNEGTVGAVMGGFMSYVFKGVHAMANLVSNMYGKTAAVAAKAAASIVTLPPFMITDEYVHRALISDYKPKTGDELKKQMWKVATILGLPRMANFAFIPPAYNIPVAAAVSTTYGLMRSGPKKEEKTPAPQGYGPQGPSY